VNKHPGATVFHTAAWLAALKRTYGYRPRALTTTPPASPALVDGLVFCEIRSPWTGRRLVSLPFSDYCGPLGDDAGLLTREALALTKQGGFRYLEIRPGYDAKPPDGMAEGASFYRHTIDLAAGPETLYRNLHKDSIARKIRRAGREGLRIGRETDSSAIREFHRLFLVTRRRHGYPPPPVQWLDNLFVTHADTASLHLARKPDGQAVAGIVLLRHSRTIYYKYGASDERFHAMGGMPLLFWDAMESAHQAGFETLDLGRSDLDGAGLIEFKEKLGASGKRISYWRYPSVTTGAKGSTGEAVRKWCCAHLPDSALAWAGARLYPHIG